VNGACVLTVGKKMNSGGRGCLAISNASIRASANWSVSVNQPNCGPL